MHAILLWAGLAAGAAAQPPADKDLTKLSLEELANLQVTSVSRHAEPLAGAAASIFAVDVRYGWRLRPELSLLGQNLFDRAHPEFNAAPGRSEFERGVFFQARWTR